MQKFQALFWILFCFLFKSSQQTIFSSELYSFLQNRSFVGVWKVSNQNEAMFSDLDLKKGEIKVEFFQHFVIFEIFNHNYQELDENFQGSFSLNHFNIINISWKDCNKTQINNSNFQIDKICIPEYIQVFVSDIHKNINNKRIAIIFNSNFTEFSQSNFQINLSTLQKNQQDDLDIILFESFSLLFLISQFIIPIYFIKYVLEKTLKYYQMSIISCFLKSREILFIFQFMASFSINNQYHLCSIFYYILNFFYFCLIIFWLLIAGSILMPKLLFYKWFREHLKMSVFITSVIQISITIINILLFNYFSSYFVFWLSYSVILYPQIIHNIRLNIEESFNLIYLFGLSPGLIFQTYLKCYSENIFDISPDYLFVGLYYFIYIISVILLYLQYKFGSRCLIPKCLKKDDEICVICLDVIEKIDWEIQMQLLPIIKTICNHKFHQECLQAWLSVKQFCPLCRKPLDL